MHRIRFYGLPDTVSLWRAAVGELTGKLGDEPVTVDFYGHPRTSYVVELSDADVDSIMASLWYAVSGTGRTDAQGRPWLWNACIGFERLRPARQRRRRRVSR